jgi:hypothetical protein
LEKECDLPGSLSNLRLAVPVDLVVLRATQELLEEESVGFRMRRCRHVGVTCEEALP